MMMANHDEQLSELGSSLEVKISVISEDILHSTNTIYGLINSTNDKGKENIFIVKHKTNFNKYVYKK